MNIGEIFIDQENVDKKQSFDAEDKLVKKYPKQDYLGAN